MFKKLLLFAAASSSLAFAVTPQSQIDALNNAIVSILAPFQQPTTKVNVAFTNIETTTLNTTAFNVVGAFTKTGPAGSFALKVDELSYDYKKLVDPTVKFKGSLAADLTKLIPQEDLNAIFNDLEVTLKNYEGELINRYGTALTYNFAITKQDKDAQGNFVATEGTLHVAIELSALPADMPSADQPLSAFDLKYKISATGGIALDSSFVMNPEYSGFKSEQGSMKEYLDKLIAQDPTMLDQIRGIVQWLENTAWNVVK